MIVCLMAHYYFQLSELISIFMVHTARKSAPAHAILFNYVFGNYITMLSIHFMEPCNLYTCTLQSSHPFGILWMCLCVCLCSAYYNILSNRVIQIFIQRKSNRSLNIPWNTIMQMCIHHLFILS